MAWLLFAVLFCFSSAFRFLVGAAFGLVVAITILAVVFVP